GLSGRRVGASQGDQVGLGPAVQDPLPARAVLGLPGPGPGQPALDAAVAGTWPPGHRPVGGRPPPPGRAGGGPPPPGSRWWGGGAAVPLVGREQDAGPGQPQGGPGALADQGLQLGPLVRRQSNAIYLGHGIPPVRGKPKVPETPPKVKRRDPLEPD